MRHLFLVMDILEGMLNEELRKLAKVQRVDAAILDLKKRFGALDPGKSSEAKLQAATQAHEAAAGRLKALRSELTDLELEQKKLEQKVESEQKRLYSGGIYNAKDADAIERETANLKGRISKADERILELWELIPPAQAENDEAEKGLAAAKAAHDEYLDKYGKVKAEFETKAKGLIVERAKSLEECDKELLEKYDTMRKKHGGIGISPIVGSECGVCHSTVSKIQKESIEAGRKLEICEGCGRYLYVPNGA